MTVTYLLCDDDPGKIGDLPAKVGMRPWSGVPDGGTALPLVALDAMARALATDAPRPSIVLVDDECRFSEREVSLRNAARTVAAFTRLFDVHRLAADERPACALFTHMAPRPSEQLTFMEFGGHGVVDRQHLAHEADAVRDTLAAARRGDVAWNAPEPRMTLSGARARTFWNTLFPLLPLIDDTRTTSALINQHLGLDRRALSRQRKLLERRLEDALVDWREHAELKRIADLGGDVALVRSAELLGVVWIVLPGVRAAGDLPASLLPAGAPPLQLRSMQSPELRWRWYRHVDDPRREHGGAWPPTLYDLNRTAR